MYATTYRSQDPAKVLIQQEQEKKEKNIFPHTLAQTVDGLCGMEAKYHQSTHLAFLLTK